MTMPNMTSTTPRSLSIAVILLSGAGALTVSLALPGAKARAAITRLRKALAAAEARPARHLYQHQPGRQRGRLGRQGRHGPGHRHRLDQDDRRGARPAARARQHGAGPHRHTIDQGGASGSTGIWKAGAALRNAAAEARRVLVEMAAEKLGVAGRAIGRSRTASSATRATPARKLPMGS